MGSGGDEEDIRKKKRIRTFYGILSLSTLSHSLSPARSLPLSSPPPLPVSPLELRGLHMEVSKRKASPSGQIFSLPWGHVVYRNAVKSLAWQAPYVRPQGVRGTVWRRWTCIPATWCGEGPVERANVVKADGDGDCYTV